MEALNGLRHEDVVRDGEKNKIENNNNSSDNGKNFIVLWAHITNHGDNVRQYESYD